MSFLKKYLLLNESEQDHRLFSTSYLELNEIKEEQQRLGIVCNINRAFWQKNSKFQLKNIIFNGQPGDLICVIGPVGSGKVCLIHSFIRNHIFHNYF